jgi:putative FmdB family regulatory protein
MPAYDFECKKCHHVYEENVPMSNTKYKGVKCPKCKSAAKTRLMSAPRFAFSNPVGTDRWNSDQNGHQYRWQYAQKSVAETRKFAEQNSHVGPKPYNEIDDISSGEHFGEVK